MNGNDLHGHAVVLRPSVGNGLGSGLCLATGTRPGPGADPGHRAGEVTAPRSAARLGHGHGHESPARQRAAAWLVGLALAGGAGLAAAQAATPVGLWKTVDDETGKERSLVRIAEEGGVLGGRIERVLDPTTAPDAVCSQCTDERKDQPIVGLPIITGMKPAEGGETWEGGQILDPKNGKVYRLRLKPVEGGAKLEVRGYVGPFYRTQTWLRAQ